MSELITALIAGLKLLEPAHLATLTPDELATLAQQLRWAAEDVDAEQARRRREEPS